jgi:hypothetical protein
MAVSVLLFNFASLRSRSRLRSQLGFFACIFDRFYDAQRRRERSNRVSSPIPAPHSSSTVPPPPPMVQNGRRTYELLCPPHCVLGDDPVHLPFHGLFYRIVLSQLRMLPRAPCLGIIVPELEHLRPTPHHRQSEEEGGREGGRGLTWMLLRAQVLRPRQIRARVCAGGELGASLGVMWRRLGGT